jgi:hypothetical protein
VLFVTKTELFPSANSPLQPPELGFEVLFPEKRLARVCASAFPSSLVTPDARGHPRLHITKPCSHSVKVDFDGTLPGGHCCCDGPSFMVACPFVEGPLAQWQSTRLIRAPLKRIVPCYGTIAPLESQWIKQHLT